jgi:hypothetical protein
MTERERDVPGLEPYQPPAIVRLGSIEEATGIEGGSLTVDEG